MQTVLSDTFDQLVLAFASLEDEWTDPLTLSGLRWAFGDARHHLCFAMGPIEDHAADPALRAPHAAYEVMDDAARVLAHEAYASILTLGQLVRHAREGKAAPEDAIEVAEASVRAMLDQLEPFVTRAEVGLKRTMLDDVPLEQVIAEAYGTIE